MSLQSLIFQDVSAAGWLPENVLISYVAVRRPYFEPFVRFSGITATRLDLDRDRRGLWDP